MKTDQDVVLDVMNKLLSDVASYHRIMET